jgi:hypothetical protein
MAARPHASRQAPGRNRSEFGGSGVAGGFKGKRIFISRKKFLSLKNPSKSILTPKIMKPFPENF